MFHYLWRELTDVGDAITAGAGIPEAPLDGTQYGRQNANWTAITTTETDTLDSVTSRGNTTTNSITVGNFTSTGIDDNATSTAITIDASENVGIGTTTPTEPMHVRDIILVEGGLPFRNSFGQLNLYNSMSFSGETPLGNITFQGLGNSAAQDAASITCWRDVTWATTSFPSNLRFNTTATGSSTPSERMRITSDGNVGIGTDAPEGLLHIEETTAATTANLFMETAATKWSIGVNGVTGRMTFQNNVSGLTPFKFAPDAVDNLFRVGVLATDTVDVNGNLTVTGNVGIGTTTPASLLEVSGPTAWTGYIRISDTAGSGIILNDKTTPTDKWTIQRRHAGSGSLNGILQFNTNSAASGSISNVLALTDAGSVGVGTDTPLATLDVFGDIRTTRTTARIQFKQTAAADLNFDMTCGAAGALAFRTQNEDFTVPVERMRIASNGDVGIGTNTPRNVTNFGILTLNGTTGSILQLRNGDVDGARVQISPSNMIILTEDARDIAFNTQGTSQRMIIKGDTGNVGIGTSSPTNVLEMEREGVVQLILNTKTPLGDSGIRFRQDGSTVGRILSRVDKSLGFFAGGSTERMRIDPAGDVGIGTTAPAQKLHVSNDGASAVMVDSFGVNSQFIGRSAMGTEAAPLDTTANAVLFGIAARGWVSGNWSATRGFIVVRAENAWTASDQSTYMRFETTASGTTSRTEKMRISSDGKVGIGIATPDAALSVVGVSNGLIAKFGGNSSVFDRALQINAYSVYGINNAGFELNAPGAAGASATLSFATGGTERMRIDSAGAVTLAALAGGGTTLASIDNAGTIVRLATPEVQSCQLYMTTVQNLGGAVGTATAIDWKAQDYITGTYTHSTTTNPSRVTVNTTGRYNIRANIAWENRGGARAVIGVDILVNGVTAKTRGRGMNYSRGINQDDGISTNINTELALTSGDYIEIIATLDDADSNSYVINTQISGCELILNTVAG